MSAQTSKRLSEQRSEQRSKRRSKHLRGPDRSPVDAEGYHRVHRLTPLLRFWSIILALFMVIGMNFDVDKVLAAMAWLGGGHWRELGWGSLLGGAGFVVLCLVIWFASAIWWRRLGYKLSAEDISLRHGVISTNFRTARCDRIQAVDIVEPVIARLFGLAAVRVETAGGQASVINIRYLEKAAAVALQGEILEKVRLKPVAPAAEVEAQLQVPVSRALLGTLLRTEVLGMVVLGGVLMLLPGGVKTVLPFAVGFVPTIFALVNDAWQYTAVLDVHQGVLRISHGLADRRWQSIRLERIHGVKVSQHVLWRFLGWYEVQVSVAGYGRGKQSGTTRVLPVGTREQALWMFAMVSELSPAEIERFARPEGFTEPDFTSPRRAWVSSPIDCSRQAVTLVRDVVITHAGRFNRRVCCVPMPHIQELTYAAGPLRQAVGVGSVRLELVTGRVHMQAADLEPADARALLTRLRTRRLPELAAPGSLDGAVET